MLSRNALLIFLGLMATLLQCAYAQGQEETGEGGVALPGGGQPAAGGGGNNSEGGGGGRGGEAAKPTADEAKDPDEKENETGTNGPKDKPPPQGQEPPQGEIEIPTEEPKDKADDKAAAGSGIPESAAKDMTKDACTLAGTVKLGVAPIQAPCTVIEAMEVECQGRSNFINPADGNAVPSGEQFMDTYKQCLLGKDSTYIQDAEACIKCKEANKLITSEEATKLRDELKESIDLLRKDDTINQTVKELREAKAESRGEMEKPEETADKVVELKDYYKNQPPVQQVGSNSVDGVEAGGEPGKNGTTAGEENGDGNRADGDGDKAGGPGEAPPPARRLRRSLTKRQQQRAFFISMMVKANFICSTPLPPIFPQVQFRQQLGVAPRIKAPPQPTTLKTTAVRTAARPAPTQGTNNQLVVKSAFASCLCRVVIQCLGRGVYVIARTCAPPILMQNSAVTPQRRLEQPSKRLPVFNQCSECSKKQVPINQITSKPVAAVTTKCDNNVCKEATKDVQKAVTSDNLLSMVLLVQFSEAPVQLENNCDRCLGGGNEVLPFLIPDNRQPAAQAAPAPRPQQRPQQQPPQPARPAAAPQRPGQSCR
ncbi:hypothetical protein CP532_2332 [Ophiocordyceps camponoti-leonardi (nom. inval.)]|nr:hypothetical protein CP532_2332 [Ophiocordyceps camponoti-leonardi (nom. inval.)]